MSLGYRFDSHIDNVLNDERDSEPLIPYTVDEISLIGVECKFGIHPSVHGKACLS